MNKVLACYAMPSLLLRRQLNQPLLRWATTTTTTSRPLDDLWAQPRMEIWPTSRILRSQAAFFDHQMQQLNREMDREMDWPEQRLQAMAVEQQKLQLVQDDGDAFTLSFACKNFRPEQIQCKLSGQYLIVEGKHESKDEKTGSASSMHFVRRILLPENAVLEQLNCIWMKDGVLSINIPKKQPAIQDSPAYEKVIPIQQEEEAK